MSARFYFDENVNRAVPLGLRLLGVDVLTVQEDGRSGASDPEVLDRATELERVLFTQDDDLLAEARMRELEGSAFASVIFAAQMNVTVGQCVADLQLFADAASSDENLGQVFFLPF